MRQAQQLNCHFLWWSWQNTYTHTYLTLLPSTSSTTWLASSNLGDHNILELIYHLHWTQNRSNESHASCPCAVVVVSPVCVWKWLGFMTSNLLRIEEFQMSCSPRKGGTHFFYWGTHCSGIPQLSSFLCFKILLPAWWMRRQLKQILWLSQKTQLRLWKEWMPKSTAESENWLFCGLQTQLWMNWTAAAADDEIWGL